MDKIIKGLAQLSNEYRPVPFWSWNDRLDPERLREQIRWMHEMGIGGFFMHARGGLKTSYLSCDWMEAIEASCEEAQKLGMHAWAYDENGWPSGFAGGKLLEDIENRDMYITYSIGRLDDSADASYALSGDRLIRVAHNTGEGEYLNLYLQRSASTVDILNPDVVQKFLEATHEQYKRSLGPLFSEKIAGFFTDEPQYYRPATPYTPMMDKLFRDEYGTDILDQLGLLFVEKEGYRTFRYRYWLGMQKLMLNGFAKQVHTWCKDNGVRFTGHYVEEPTMGGQLMCCGGVMPFYEYEDMPGIDWLGSNTKNEVSPRQLGSAARQLGKKQTLTETFGCCGWNISPADLMRIAGFQYACGVNMMCHHLLPYSEHGQRKKDFPAHFNPINPWIDGNFRNFNDYFSRLGYLLSNSAEPVNVAMLHPMRSAYLNYKRGDNAEAIPESELDKDLQKACRTLSSRGISYHFLDETLLEKHGFTEGAAIGCGACSYTYLVIPKILTMSSHTEKLLRRFVSKGGKVLLLDDKPAYLEGEAFDYGYLSSNCTLEEIAKAQPCVMENGETELYCTYRIYEDKPFLFVQNASAEHGYTQTFSFRDGVSSFTALDLITFETKKLPLTVALEKNEALLLFPSSEPAPMPSEQKIVTFRFRDAQVQFDHNFMTLDAVRFSKDGISYSETVLCSNLCQQLLAERYEGDIYLRYDFEVQTVPERLHLLTEKNNSRLHKVNGRPVRFDKTLKEEPCVAIADISQHIQPGINSYETALHWHQSEETYYALFGEGVTESLKNCIAYDSEIEPVYLAGYFGVYGKEPFEFLDGIYAMGSDFYLAAAPAQVSEPVTDGLPFFRGDLTVSQAICLDDPNVRLALEGDFLTAQVWVNDHYAGQLCFQSTLDISQWAKAGTNELKVTFTIGNRNLLGPFHWKNWEVFVGPHCFAANDLPRREGKGIPYKFRCFYPK